MPARTKKNAPGPEDLDAIETEIIQVFEQTQNSAANHQKNFVALYKLHCQADSIKQRGANGSNEIHRSGEKRFGDVFMGCLFKTRLHKKGVTPADRTLKFAGGYVSYCNRKTEEKDEQGEKDGADASIFTKRVVKAVCVEGRSKDKVFRYRAVYFLAEMLSNMPDVEEDPYQLIRTLLFERSRDKEVSVRVQAVIGLSKLVGTDEEVSDEDDNGQPLTTLNRVIECMHKDPSAEVRRAAMLNLSVTETTLNELLKRSRDTDNITRKLLYSQVLPKGLTQPGEDGQDMIGPSHPKVLNISQRELIANNGLGDREPAVKSAAASLLCKWLDSLSEEDSTIKKEEDKDDSSLLDVPHTVKKLTAILALYVLQDESKTAKDVLLAIFEFRREIFESLAFDANYWEALNPEMIFLVRVYVDHCIANDDQARLDEALPVVTSLAFRIQQTYNALLDSLENDVAQDVDDSILDAQFEKEFLISEMLRIAVNLDYSDEMGRRKMYDLTREMLGSSMLPEGLIPGCLDVLRKLSFDERDLIRIVVQIVQDMRDPEGDVEDESKDLDDDDDDGEAHPRPKKPRSSLYRKPVEELTPEECQHSDEVDLRCLILCIHMLERIMGTLEEHTTLDGIIKELIIPAALRKDLLFRVKGLHALGLVGLIARPMAAQSLELLSKQAAANEQDIQSLAIKLLFDIFMVHNRDLLETEHRNWLKDLFFSLLVNEDRPLDPQIQFLLCEGLAKLALAKMLDDDDVLLMLWRAYVDPSTIANRELRQCLAYFFPVYGTSSQRGQRKLCEIFPSVFKAIDEMRDDLEDDEKMSTTAQIVGMFAEWTNPYLVKESGMRETVDEDLHIDLATTIVQVILDKDYDFLEKEDEKAILLVLPKLYLPDTVDDLKIRNLKVLVHGLLARKTLPDATSKTAVNKFENQISTKYKEQLAAFTEEEWKIVEHSLKVLSMSDGEDSEEDGKPKRKTRKRRSESMASDTESAMSSTRGKGNSKRRRVSQTDEDDEDYDAPEDTSARRHHRKKRGAQAPTRTMPKRSAATRAKKKVEVATREPEEMSVEEDDEDDKEEEDEEEQSEDEEGTPAPQRRSTRTARRQSDDMETPRPKRRSRVGESEEESEVNGLLDDSA